MTSTASRPGLGHDLGHHPALPAQVLGPAEGPQPDVRPAGPAGVRRTPGRELGPDAVARGPVGQPRLDRAGAALLDPERHLDEQSRRGPLGRVGIEGDVEPFGPGVVDQGEQPLRAAGVRLAVVEVGDVGGRAGAPADLDRLADRVEVAVAERIADVGVVEAAVSPGLLGQGRQLRGRGETPRRVVEPAAQAERALGHPVAQDAAHPVDGVGVDRDVLPAERGDAELRVADERGHVEADGPVVTREVGLDR